MSDEITPLNIAIDGLVPTIAGSMPANDSVASIIDSPNFSLAKLQNTVCSKLKRAFDLSLAFVLLVLVLPLGCLIILSIAIAGQRPFCAQTRMGRSRREFGCLKFTTMRSNAEVTPLGQVLHATCLDELPQLINILVGEMSFAGPQPVTNDDPGSSDNAPAVPSLRPG